jgi:phosphoserine aminotransferase
MVSIPAGLLPADGRFGSGPSKVRPEQLAALTGPGAGVLGTSHRQKPVKEVVRRVREGLGALFDLPEGYEVVLGNGGSTCFWDVAAFNLVRDRAQFLVFGEFGGKFAEGVAAAPFLGDPDVRRAEPGSAPDFAPDDAFDV